MKLIVAQRANAPIRLENRLPVHKRGVKLLENLAPRAVAGLTLGRALIRRVSARGPRE